MFEAISSKEFQSSLKDVSRGFLGSFQVFHGSLMTVMEISKVFQSSPEMF